MKMHPFGGSERINQLLTKAADLNHSVSMMSRPRWMGLRRPHCSKMRWRHCGALAIAAVRSTAKDKLDADWDI